MSFLVGKEAESFLRGLPIAKSYIVKSLGDAKKAVKKLGYPVVLKLISEQIIHKTDIGGVRVVRASKDLEKEFSKLLSIAREKKIKLHGILVQEYISGVETIIGLKKDQTFGYVIMFGIGGTLVELVKDVSFRVCPIKAKDVESMIEDLKFKRILFGFRGNKPVNLKLLKRVLVKVSKLPKRYKIKELDINPFIINDKDGKVVDVRILV